MDDCQIAILPINGWMKGKLTMERLVSWAYLRNGWLMVKEKEESES